MVYYGALSKGCELCRQRKIKCDQRKPRCSRCEKAKMQCPGFRDLVDVTFRDESERIIRRARKLHGEIGAKRSLAIQSGAHTNPKSGTILHPLSQSIDELGVNFFFSKYSCDGPRFSESCHAWLAQIYRETPPNHALRAAIEAVGMAGISNVSYAPQIACRSRLKYGRAVAATQQVLSDPCKSIADATLMTVMLLGLFEFIMMENWDDHCSSATHIEGATAMLQLRGQEQFNYELGGQLFMQLRSQILYMCIQQELPVPQVLEQMSHRFEACAFGQSRQNVRPRMATLCLRFLGLRAAIKNGGISGSNAIHRAATEIDRELEASRAGLHPTWSYTTVDDTAGTYFEGKRHIYNSVWTAEAWNNWRTLRILVNQVILQHEIYLGAFTNADESGAMSLIRQLSTDICVSAATLIESARSVALIWPLSVVSREDQNLRSTRYWAVDALRRINSSTGFRQAGLFADNISRGLKWSPRSHCEG